MSMFSLVASLLVPFVLSQDDITTTEDPNPSSCDLTCGVDDDLLDVVEYMQDLGYSTSTGYFELYDEATSNIYIPFARDDTDYLVAHFDDGGDGSVIRFGGQDAIVFRGCTPPPIKYFGYRSYSAARIKQQDSDGNIEDYTILESSLGDTLNQNEINTDPSASDQFEAPYDAKTNIITTGDEQTYTDLINAFSSANLLLHNAVNLDAVNNGYFAKWHESLGYFRYSASDEDIPRDTISLVIRVVWDEESECTRNQYFNGTFQYPLYVFSKPEKKPRCHINVPLRPTRDKYQKCEKCYENEYYFNKAISNIIRTMKEDHNLRFVSNTPLNNNIGSCLWGGLFPPNNDENVYIFQHGFYCITFQKDCMFDNRDTYYSWDRTDHTLSDNDYYLIVGLNHNKFQMSTMNSISMYYVEDPNDNANPFKRIETINDDEYEQYNFRDIFECKKRRSLAVAGGDFQHHPDAQIDTYDNEQCRALQNVFAVQVTRPVNVIDGLPSITPDTDILSYDERFIFFGEATLNPKTNTMPDESCLIEWRLLRFTKCPTNTAGITDNGGTN